MKKGGIIVEAGIRQQFEAVMSRARKSVSFAPVDSVYGDMYVWGQPDNYIRRKIREAEKLAKEQAG